MSSRRAWLITAVLMLATGIFCSLHLGRPLGASEAYTALAAEQDGLRAVIDASLRFDPGKPPLYPLAVHGVESVLGRSDGALRLASALCAMIDVALTMALGSLFFSPAVGVGAAMLWALSPFSIMYGTWARVYALLIGLSLWQLILLWQLRTQSSGYRATLCGAAGAAMLYAHLGAALFLAAEAMMLAGAERRGQRSRAAWAALLLSAIFFLPFLPIAWRQTEQLLAGHWMDWIGPARHAGFGYKAAVFALAAAAIGVLMFAPAVEDDWREPLRWCAGVGLIPIIVLAACSMGIRPLFNIRYVAPSCAILILLCAAALKKLPARAYRLTLAGMVTALSCLLPFYPWYEPWRDMATIIARGGPRQAIFFESGYVGATAVEDDPKQGFPQGFFRVPLDRYFKGPNPRLVVDPSAPASARRLIASSARANHGAWLLSSLDRKLARAESAGPCLHIEPQAAGDYATLYHVIPQPNCSALSVR